MEKIQTETVSMVQAAMKAGGARRASGVDAAFDKLLKEQSRNAEDKTQDATASGTDPGKNASGIGKENIKPVKESGQKEETEEPEDKSLENGGMIPGGVVPGELLLQLQESAGGLQASLAEAAAEISEQTGEVPGTAALPELIAEAEPEAVPAAEIPAQAVGPAEVTEQTERIEPETLPGTVQVQKEAVQAEAAEGKQEPRPEAVNAGKTDTGKTDAGKIDSVKADPADARPAEKAGTYGDAAEAGPAGKPAETKAPEKVFAAETKGEAQEHPGQEEQSMAGITAAPREYEMHGAEHADFGPVRTSEPTMVQDVGRAIAQRFPETNGTLTIELEPASLGKLTIHVLYESGRATISILATNPRTMELLNAKATELASILEERTGQETVIYTEQPESERPFDERQSEGQQREQGQENREHKEKSDQDSFLQQLRLGFI